MNKKIYLSLKIRLSFSDYRDFEMIDIECHNISALQSLISKENLFSIASENNAEEAVLVSIDLMNASDNTTLGMLNRYSDFFLLENAENLNYIVPDSIGCEDWEFDLQSLIDYINQNASSFNIDPYDIGLIQNISHNILNDSIFRDFVSKIYDADFSFEFKKQQYLDIVGDFVKNFVED